MDDLWTAERFAKWKYETDEPTKSQIVCVYQWCRDGRLPATKVCGQWRIDTSQILRGARNG